VLRAVVDPAVLIAGVISPTGAPTSILRAWVEGLVELVVCPALIDELRRALGYPKVATRVPATVATGLVGALERAAIVVADPSDVPRVCRDPGDDYLFALAREAEAVLVSGDADVLAVASPPVRVLSPRAVRNLLSRLAGDRGAGPDPRP
jgi:putative PIN family toxin of toxin-antitoxin system